MRQGISEDSVNIILASISSSTWKQYDSCIRYWFDFCKKCNENFFEASVQNIMSFFTMLFNAGKKYGTLNSCRSALCLILGNKFSQNDKIVRFFKGIYNLRPNLPKYNIMWDPSVVLDHLKEMFPNENITLECLSKKLIVLLALATGQRVQTLSLININNIEHKNHKIYIKIPEKIKTSSCNSLQPFLILPFFEANPGICPARTLLDYLKLTKDLRFNNTYLFLSFKKPHREVSTQTLSRWIKTTLADCGIDTTIFTAHSTRHAATSAAQNAGANIDTIRKSAGWSDRSKAFARFYNRPIIAKKDDCFAKFVYKLDWRHT